MFKSRRKKRFFDISPERERARPVHQYQRLGASRTGGVRAELSAGSLASAALGAVAVAGAVVVGDGLRVKLLPGLAFVLSGALVAAALFRRASVPGEAHRGGNATFYGETLILEAGKAATGSASLPRHRKRTSELASIIQLTRQTLVILSISSNFLV
jgi:hypothetical protein